MKMGETKGNEHVIRAANLTVGYSGYPHVLSQIDFQWEGAGIHLIMGGNGSGKSTLIRTLAGLQKQRGGNVFWGNEDVSQISSTSRTAKMAFVQSLPPRQSELTVSEALALSGRKEEQINHWLHTFDLLNTTAKSLCNLSDGLGQRVMLVRAILQDTPWILLDEPTAFLDVMLGQLSALVSQGKRVMVSSHDYHLLEGNFDLRSVTAIRENRLHTLSPTGTFADWNAHI
jgi:iron complex transport system ATP-binding protein